MRSVGFFMSAISNQMLSMVEIAARAAVKSVGATVMSA
jgi:hypothetical protein